MPNDILFVERTVYDWQFYDELSVCAVYANKPQDAAHMMERLLNSPRTPQDQIQRLEANLRFAQSRAQPKE